MQLSAIAMTKRINIILPNETVALLDRVAVKGDRSRFIDRAVRYYIETCGKDALRKRLAEGYRATAEQDLEMAAEWFPLEEEAHALANKTEISAGEKGKRK